MLKEWELEYCLDNEVRHFAYNILKADIVPSKLQWKCMRRMETCLLTENNRMIEQLKYCLCSYLSASSSI